MTKVVRFFHIRPLDGASVKFNGATVMVVGDTDQPGQVDVKVTFCSRKDQYSRKQGRKEAELSTVTKVVQLRYLPRELGRIEEKVYGFELEGPTDYCFSLKYFLPKE